MHETLVDVLGEGGAKSVVRFVLLVGGTIGMMRSATKTIRTRTVRKPFTDVP